MNEKKLLSIEDAENLSINAVQNYYKEYISKSQVDLIGSFGFGNDLVEKAEGSYIFLKNGRKIINKHPDRFLKSVRLKIKNHETSSNYSHIRI